MQFCSLEGGRFAVLSVSDQRPASLVMAVLL